MSQVIKDNLIDYIINLNFRDSDLKELCIAFTKKYIQETEDSGTKFVNNLKETLIIFSDFNRNTFQWVNLKHVLLEHAEKRNVIMNFTLYISLTDYLEPELRVIYQSEKKNLLRGITNKKWSSDAILKMTYISSLFLPENNNGRITVFIINVRNRIILNLLCDFINSDITVLKMSKKFFRVFEDSIKDKTKLDKINTFKDFSFDLFKEQFEYYENIELSNILCSFYLFIWGFEPNFNLFPVSSGIDYKTLKRKSFFKEYRDGYRLVIYNPLDPIPVIDKWILDYNGFGDNYLLVNRVNGTRIDFTKISNKLYRYYIKIWIWKDSSISIHAKLNYFFQISNFLNYLSLNKKNNENTISIEEAISYKNYILSTVESDTNASKYLYNIRGILHYLKEEKFMQIEDNVFYHLKYSSRSKNNAKTVPDEELKKIANLMKENAELSDLNKLYYLIFYIILETEFRITQILALEIDCVRNTTKKEQYIIESKTKTSNGNNIPQSITIYVKKQIDDILRITQDLRNECNEKRLKKRLFIKRNYSRKHIISTVTPENFNTYLSECCMKLRLTHYTTSNLRDTHITKAEEFLIRNNLSNIQQSVLTGHRSTDTDNKHYIQSNIIDMLEITHETIIGDIDINGQVIACIDETVANKENEVENGCGYFKNQTCSNMSYLSCFMCNYFVATIDRIPYFEEQIKIIDYKIIKVAIQHDKEDLLNIKQLLLNYLKELYLKKEEVRKNG